MKSSKMLFSLLASAFLLSTPLLAEAKGFSVGACQKKCISSEQSCKRSSRNWDQQHDCDQRGNRCKRVCDTEKRYSF